MARPEVSRIRVPPLVVYRDGTARCDLGISEEMQSTMPGSEVVKISGAGHFGLVEKAETVNVRLTNFLPQHG